MKEKIRKAFNACGLQVYRYKKPIVDCSVYHRLYDDEYLKEKPFYNIGAGSFYHPFWKNVDFYNDWYQDNKININYDLMELKPLPIESETAEVIYTSHTLEHITDEAVDNILSEGFRVLKEGGTIRIAVPNTDVYYNAYINNDYEFYRNNIRHYSKPEIIRELELFPMCDASLGDIFLYYFAATVSPLTKYDLEKKISEEELNKIFSEKEYSKALDYICSFCHFDPKKSGYHINWMNEIKVVDRLKKAGFSDVYVSAFGQSRNPILRDTKYFDNTVPEVSCYIEARK